MARRFVGLFTLWVILGATVAFVRPTAFSGYGATIVPLLGIVMLGVGVTLRLEDFRLVLASPKAVIVGVAAQFIWMPLLGFLLAHLLHLSPSLAAGEVLVGACPGGTASNVLTFLAGGDVALAVTMTGVTTLLAPVLTPLLTYVYANAWVKVPVLEMLAKTTEIVLIPVVLGIVLRRLAGRFEGRLLEWMPAVSVAGIVWIISVIVAGNHDTLLKVGGTVLIAVALHNVLGMAAGYLTARAFSLGDAQVRAIAIEVAVQDSGLGVVLAKGFFGNAAALPSAVFSVWQNLSGPVAAWFFRRNMKS
jgi:BASS family bile acid:Na+ symporter